jgi:hypothetical protein
MTVFQQEAPINILIRTLKIKASNNSRLIQIGSLKVGYQRKREFR